MADPADGTEGRVTRSERLAADWCRAWGDDHGVWLRKLMERCVDGEVERRRRPPFDNGA